MGTPAYMSPEQARGESVDQRADVFALGAMLYHLLAGVPPYTARTATDVIAAAALGKVVPLRERERRAPPELVAIVERAMAPLAVDRYDNAGRARRRAAPLPDRSARRRAPLHRGRSGSTRFVKRHRAAVTVSAIAIVGFAVGGTIAVRNVVRARDEARHAERVAVTRKQAAERLIDYMFSRHEDAARRRRSPRRARRPRHRGPPLLRDARARRRAACRARTRSGGPRRSI